MGEVWWGFGGFCLFCLFAYFTVNRYIIHPACLLHIAILDPANLNMSQKHPPFISQTFYLFKREARKGTEHTEAMRKGM